MLLTSLLMLFKGCKAFGSNLLRNYPPRERRKNIKVPPHNWRAPDELPKFIQKDCPEIGALKHGEKLPEI